MSKSLPLRPSLNQLRRQAKDLLKQVRRKEKNALVRLQESLPEVRELNELSHSEHSLTLAQAQRAIAREYGFASWPKLKLHIESLSTKAHGNSHVALLSSCYEKIVDSLPADASIGSLMVAMSLELQKAHQGKEAWASVVISNWSPSLVGKSQDEIFASELSDQNSRDSVARYFGFRSWDAIGEAGSRMLDSEFELAVEAVIHGDLPDMRERLLANPRLVEKRSNWGHRSTLLHYVAANGVEIHRQVVPPNAVDMARVLLEAGAEPDALAETYGGGVNQTPLCLLITSGHPHEVGLVEALIEVLADFGANLDGVDESGTPLKFALDFGYTKTAQALVKHGASILNVECAAGVGNLGELKRHLNGNPEQHRLDEALYFAARNGHSNCIQPIIEAGANVNSRGHFGGPALHWAALNGYDVIVKCLVGAGRGATQTYVIPDSNPTRPDGRTRAGTDQSAIG